MRTRPGRGWRPLAATMTAAAMLLTGCGFTGIYDLPLPGGADVGDNPFEMKVQFREVLDLVPQTHVKVNEVAVGRIQDVALAEDGWHAEVTLLVNGDIELPANSFANIKQSSLLGEKYVEIVPPPNGTGRGSLGEGAVIPLARTNRNTEIEEVLGALSLLLNAGGVEQINTIAREMNNIYKGAGGTEQLKATLHNSEAIVKSFDAQTGDIERALDGIARLSKTLNADKDVIEGALDDLAPGMRVLTRHRKALVRMLQAVANLGGVATDTMRRSKADLVANLKALIPIVRNLANAGQDLPNSLELLVSFPFADSAVPAVKGDYFNLTDAHFLIDVEEILANFDRNQGEPFPGVPILKDVVPAPGDSPLPGLPLQLPGTSGTTSGGLDSLLDSLSGGGL